MRILVAPDKFKGSLGAGEVAEHIAAGVRDRLPDAEITTLPIADGGEGTASVICSAAGGDWHACAAHDALGHPIEARYCTIANGDTAVMEASEAAGLWRVPSLLRDPDVASSFGLGEMLLAASRGGATNIMVGLGGSATSDGGFGMAQALGYRFFDSVGREIGRKVTDLLRLHVIAPPSQLCLPKITAAADVRNPLLGSAGATRTFGPQKGATAEQIERLELALIRLADVVARDLGREMREIPGSGAAGGLGFGLMAFCGAVIRSGFDVVAEQIGLEAAVRDSDIVITGEGRLDAQTLQGKGPLGVARLARACGKRVFAIVGEFEAAPGLGEFFDSIVVAKPEHMPRDVAIKNAPSLLRLRAREFAEHLRQDPAET